MAAICIVLIGIVLLLVLLCVPFVSRETLDHLGGRIASLASRLEGRVHELARRKGIALPSLMGRRGEAGGAADRPS